MLEGGCASLDLDGYLRLSPGVFVLNSDEPDVSMFDDIAIIDMWRCEVLEFEA